MERIIEIIKKLKNTKSINEKISILKNNNDNKLLQKVLYYTMS